MAEPPSSGSMGARSGGWHGAGAQPQRAAESVSNAVNHPPHYTRYKGLEIIQLTEQMNFNRVNAVKYITRAGLKNPDTEIQDLRKAEWYIRREIERIEDERIAGEG